MVIALNDRFIETGSILEVGEITKNEYGAVSFTFFIEKSHRRSEPFRVFTKCYFTERPQDTNYTGYKVFTDVNKLRQSKEYKEGLKRIEKLRNTIVAIWAKIDPSDIHKIEF